MSAVRCLTLGFAAFLVGVVALADRGLAASLFAPVYAFPGGDKVGHLVLMGTLSFLVNLSLAARTFRLGPWSVLAGTAAVLVVVTLEELSQVLIPTRTFSLLDLAFDIVGIVAFGQAALAVVRRLETRACS